MVVVVVVSYYQVPGSGGVLFLELNGAQCEDKNVPRPTSHTSN